MDYEIKWDERAYKELKKLDRQVAIRILKNINRLPQSPFTKGEPLKGKFKNKFRLRIGDYRVIYWVEKNTIWIISVGHRKETYR